MHGLSGRWSAMLMALALWAVLATPSLAATARDYDVASGHYFEQGITAPSSGGRGFVVADDEAAPFWGEFCRLGGIRALGYPISRRYACDGATCQVFEHAVFKWSPGAREVELLNVFDWLHKAGRDPWLKERWGVPAWAGEEPPSTREKDRQKQERARDKAQQTMLDANASIKTRYGLLGALAPTVYGQPRAFRDSDGRAALRTQRAVLIHSPDAPGQVRLVPAGLVFAEAELVPTDALEPIAAPAPADATAPTWIAAPELGIEAAVIPMDMGADNLLPVPDNGRVVAWYSYGARLGDGGNAVLAGHVDWDRKPGTFWRLRDARPGQTITLFGKAGLAYDYRVDWVRSFPEDSDVGLAALGSLGDDMTVTLVTCGGRFDARTRAYEDRLVVRATLVARRPWEAPR